MGVPVIGCRCDVCRSPNPRNRRLRASLLLQAAGLNIVVDTGPDFRAQMLSTGIKRLDAVLLTHSHTDHVCGFDDIRRFNDIQPCQIPIYGSKETLADLSRIFPYIHQIPPPGISLPRVRLCPFSRTFKIGSIRVTPLPVIHGKDKVFGFRFDHQACAAAYIPDCHTLPDSTLKLMAGLDVMILDALRHTPHPHHLTLDAAIKELQKIKARRSFITHLSHGLEHASTQASLPRSMHVPYDGLAITIRGKRA